ncbi:hypothetical protein DXG01_012950 [Tephrocybe rancida]|nr:hypothetical protein DXG01_012950 [Tephrocybe rancida]
MYKGFVCLLKPLLPLTPNGPSQNLENLTVKHPENPALLDAKFLMHRGLRSLTLLFNSHYVPAELSTDMLPSQLLSGLAHLKIGTYNNGVQPHLPGLPALLRHLLCLETIELPQYTATCQFLEALSVLPALESIVTSPVEDPVERCNGLHPESPSLQRGAFPMLTSLTISECASQVIHLLESRHFPTTITSLTLETFFRDEDDPARLAIFVEKCTDLNEVSIRDDSEHSRPQFRWLKGLLSTTLTRLEVKSYWALDLDASDINSLIHSLPSIEILYLNTSSVVDRDYRPHKPFTFNNLPAFFRYCPKLRELGITVGASRPYDIIEDASLPPSQLQILQVGSSWLDPEFVCASAAFLAQVLPRKCCVCYEDTTHMETWRTLIEMLHYLRMALDLGEARCRASNDPSSLSL